MAQNFLPNFLFKHGDWYGEIEIFVPTGWYSAPVQGVAVLNLLHKTTLRGRRKVPEVMEEGRRNECVRYVTIYWGFPAFPQSGSGVYSLDYWSAGFSNSHRQPEANAAWSWELGALPRWLSEFGQS
jgi:hypothetical protein